MSAPRRRPTTMRADAGRHGSDLVPLRATPNYSAQQAASHRGDLCLAWCGRRYPTLISVSEVAPLVGITAAQLLDLEAGALSTTEAGWGALHEALSVVQSRRRPAG